MATRKTAVTEAEPEVKIEDTAVEEAPKAEEEVQDPWKVMVSMLVPRHHVGESENYYVCVNDRRYYIPRNGTKQEIPQPIAEVLQASIEAEGRAEEFAENMPHASAPKQ